LKIWHGRHAAPLVIIWAVALGLVAVMYKIQDVQPGFTELLRPVYLIVFAVALFITWKWFRARTRGKKHDRRHTDRRHTDRRRSDDRD
jgi:type VI protein secretion system component VasK